MSNKRYLVGVDIGTTGSKGVLVDGRPILAYHYMTQRGRPKAGWYEHDPSRVVGYCISCAPDRPFRYRSRRYCRRRPVGALAEMLAVRTRSVAPAA